MKGTRAGGWRARSIRNAKAPTGRVAAILDRNHDVCGELEVTRARFKHLIMPTYKTLALGACIGILLPGAHFLLAQNKRGLGSQVPAWVPVYPATAPSNIQSMPGGTER